MKLRALTVTALLLAGCAPAPLGVPAAPEDLSSSESSSAPAQAPIEESPAEESTPAVPTTSGEASGSPSATEENDHSSSEPVEEPTASEASSPSVEPTSTESSQPPSESDGWQVLDAEVRQPSDIAALDVDEAISSYLTDRLEEDCDVEFVIYAVNGRYMVADESGTCAGQALMAYGPATGGAVAELVEFTQVQPCDVFEAEGLPPNVPTTEKFPDGLVCGSGERY